MRAAGGPAGGVGAGGGVSPEGAGGPGGAVDPGAAGGRGAGAGVGRGAAGGRAGGAGLGRGGTPCVDGDSDVPAGPDGSFEKTGGSGSVGIQVSTAREELSGQSIRGAGAFTPHCGPKSAYRTEILSLRCAATPN